MGEVLEVYDAHMDRRVALKRMRSDVDQSERFVAEARVTGRLDHPNIVPVHDIGVDSTGRVYYTMKRIEGQSLRHLLRGDPGSIVERLQLFLKVCDAIGYAHAQGIVHRDLKPSNIMLGAHGEVHVVDWGLARPIGAPGSSGGVKPGDSDTTSVAGTPAYMPPEQARGDAQLLNERTDIYALGVVLHVLLTGAGFYKNAEQALEGARRGDRPPILPPSADFPKELRALVEKACQPDPARRFQSVGELKAEVLRFLGDEPLLCVHYGLRSRLRRWARQNRGPVVASQAVVVTALLLLTVLGSLYVHNVQQARRDAERQLGLTEIAQSELLLSTQRHEEGLLKARSALARLQGLGLDIRGVSVSTRLHEQLRPGRFLRWPIEAGTCGAIALDADGQRGLTAVGDEVTLWALPEARALGTWALPDEAGGLHLSFLDGHPIALWQRGAEWVQASLPDGKEVRSYPSTGTAKLLEGIGAVLIPVDGERTPFDLRTGEVMELASGPEQALDYNEGGTAFMVRSSPAEGASWVVAGQRYDSGPGGGLHISPDASFVYRNDVEPPELHDTRDGSVRAMPPFNGDQAHFSLDSSVLVLQGFNDLIELRDPRTGGLLVSAQGLQAERIAMSGDGRRMLACRERGELLFYLLDGREAPLEVPVASEPLTVVRFSPDGVLVAAAGRNEEIALYESGTRLQLARLGPLPEGVRDLAFAPDGTRLAAAGRDGRITVWDVSTGELEAEERLPDRRACSVDWSGPFTVTALGCDGSLARWTMGQGLGVIKVLEGRPWRARHSPSGVLLMTRPDGPFHLVAMDPESGVELAAGEATAPLYGISVSPDGQLVATSSGGGTIGVYDAQTLEPLSSVGSAWGPGLGVAFHPSLPILVSSTAYGELVIWDLATWDRLATIPAHAGAIADIALSGDGHWMASVGVDGTMMVFDLQAPLPWEASEALRRPGEDGGLTPERREQLGRTVAALGAPELALSLSGPELDALERARLETLAGGPGAARAWKRAADEGDVSVASLQLILSALTGAP